jgi:hypothetical protein
VEPILFVLTLAFFSGAIGIFTLDSRRFLGATCAGVMLALQCRRGFPGWRWWLLVTSFLVLLMCARQPEGWLLLTSAVICLSARLAPDREAETTRLCHGVAAGIFSVLFLFWRQYAIAWVTLEKAIQRATEWTGRVGGSGISYGATASGIWILLALLAVGGSYLVHAKGRTDRTIACVFCAYVLAIYTAFLVWGESLALWGARPIGSQLMRYPGSGHLFTDRAAVALHAPLILLTGGLAVAAWLLPRVNLEISPKASGKGKAGLLTVCIFAMGVLAAFAGPLSRTKGSRVLFYGNGMLDWRVPIHGVIGIGQAGMFGLLPRYLEASGFHTKRLQRAEQVNDTALGDTDILVVINPTRPFSAQELRDVWAFVRNGGGLLVLGDHTDLMGIMGPLNQLLGPIPIRFRFDSAFSIRHWVGDYECFEHPVTRRLDSSNDLLQQGTGASLELGAGAFPLVVGKFAFSDAGDRENKLNAYLGDYRYETGELLSDVAFVAGAQYGAGRIVVFGDTTAFQNVAICRSGSFLTDVFSQLATRSSHRWVAAVQRYLMAGAALAVLALCLFRTALPQVGPACVALAVGMLIGGLPARRFEAVPFDRSPLAFIDTMHVNQFSLELWLHDSIGGLTTSLGRNGLLPLMLRDAPMDEIRKGRILVCIAPAKAYSRTELNVVQDFMHNGGLVIVSVGYEQKEGARPLLALAGCDIDSAPLGPIPIYKKTQDEAFIQYMMRQPHMMEAWPIIASTGLDQAFYRSGESDVIGFKRIGRGGMLVIADSKFFWDKTLEEESDGWPGNINLLRQMLEQTVGRK